MTEAQEARKKATAVGGKWRDIGKFLKQAEQAAKKGDFAKAKQQGELGYKQAMDQKVFKVP